MPYCEACGEEFERNLFGELGKFVGTADLCPKHSYLWPKYLAEGQIKGLTFSAFLALLGF